MQFYAVLLNKTGETFRSSKNDKDRCDLCLYFTIREYFESYFEINRGKIRVLNSCYIEESLIT